MRCFESPSNIQSSSWTQSQFVSWKNFKTWEMNITWMFVLKGRRGNAFHMAGPGLSRHPLHGIKPNSVFQNQTTSSKVFFKWVLKVRMCSCTVLNWMFAAQLGCWAGAPVGMFTVDVATRRSKGGWTSCHTKVFFWYSSYLPLQVKSFFM